MKIGICTCYDNHNYGSMLQAYATYGGEKDLLNGSTSKRHNLYIKDMNNHEFQ